MAAKTRAYVISLLESYHKRMNQIALLHYELEHPANVSSDEMIGAMSLGHGDGASCGKGHISIAQELHVVTRTVHKIKNRALDRLAAMYAFADRK